MSTTDLPEWLTVGAKVRIVTQGSWGRDARWLARKG